MEDTGRLKLILVGFFLAAAALGYFILVQRRNEEQTFKSQTRPVEQIETSEANPTIIIISPTPIPSVLGQTTKGGQPASATVVSSLPATGAPEVLFGIFSISAAIIGWSLKRFPK